ncbi:hypothetical protein VTL71DRAFT_1089 [Oculimacula yallundae]|uniref:Uncharacterized protein n=1 Tax=Oculimacula yallundae TaxID=86028 RepID=A0ABR4D300_9HELO
MGGVQAYQMVRGAIFVPSACFYRSHMLLSRVSFQSSPSSFPSLCLSLRLPPPTLPSFPPTVALNTSIQPQHAELKFNIPNNTSVSSTIFPLLFS